MNKTNDLWEGKESRTGEEGIFLRPTGSHETDLFIMQTTKNYDPGSTTLGWFCPYCKSWVDYNVIHFCCPQFSNFELGYSPYTSWQQDCVPILAEIKELLVKLIELLSREE